MFVLVDYSNVRGRLRQKGAKVKIQKLTEVICDVLEEVPSRLYYRLYGGWYKEKTISRMAEEITTELQDEYPEIYEPLSSSGENNNSRVRIQAELAYSMLIDPNHHLVRTVREKKSYRSVHIQSPKSNGCTREDCFLKGIKGFFQRDIVPITTADWRQTIY